MSQQQQDEFLARHLAAMRERAAAGAAAYVAFVEGFTDRLERRKLYGAASGAMGPRSTERDLDAACDIARAGIAEGLRQSATETDPAEASRRKDFANVLSYNLAADMAECWPEDSTPRARRHFVAGLAAAEDCVRWREELAKPPGPRQMAFWAKGTHEMSLGMARAAAASFERALEYARQSATTAPAAVVVGGDFGVILSAGYLGIATKSRLFDEACDAFEHTAETTTGEPAQDAAFGLAQLRCFAERLAAPDRPADLRA
jgi:hypothetical protein